MATRRMFSKTIIDTDIFLDMPLSSQALYFHLNMRADDDGFVASAKKIMRMIGASDDDFKILLAKQFIIKFDTGICVIKHWRIHNYIQKDRYSKTIYSEEKKQILIDDNKIYSKELNLLDNECIQDVSTLDTQVSLELGKDRLELEYIYKSFSEICTSLSKPQKLTETRKKAIKSRLKEYDKDTILNVFNKVEQSDYLLGKINGWKANFDWIMKPANFVKILEDNYINNKPKQNKFQDSTGYHDANPDDFFGD